VHSAVGLPTGICRRQLAVFRGIFRATLHELVTRCESVVVTVDLNIRLDRPDDPHIHRLLDVLSAHGLHCRVPAAPTYDLGGTLDLVVTRDDLVAPDVSVLKVRPPGAAIDQPSCATAARLPPVFTPTVVPTSSEQAALRQSPLPPDHHFIVAECKDDVNALAEQYNAVIAAIADRMTPTKTATCRRRGGDP